MQETYTPHQAGQLLSVNSYTVRRWCADYAGHLSPGANPTKGNARRLTAQDVDVLREVQKLRAEGLQTPAINERLAGVIFHNPTDLQPAQPAQDAPGQGQAALMVVAETLRGVEARLQAIEQRQQVTDARLLPVETQRLRIDVAFLVVAGFIAGLILGLAVWWFQ